MEDYVENVYITNSKNIAEDISSQMDITLKHYFEEVLTEHFNEHHMFTYENQIQDLAFRNICLVIIILILGAILYFTITG